MSNSHFETPKRRVNITISDDVLCAARAEGINISLTAERALESLLTLSRQQRWAREHANEIVAYNRSIEDEGLWNEGLTSFERT